MKINQEQKKHEKRKKRKAIYRYIVIIVNCLRKINVNDKNSRIITVNKNYGNLH